MNEITVSIPNRWENGAYQIKSWIEHYAKRLGQPITVNIAGETDSGAIWLTNAGTLTQQEYQAAINAVQELNDRGNRPGADIWKSRADAEKWLEEELAAFEQRFGGPSPS